jgi:putative endonuclease
VFDISTFRGAKAVIIHRLSFYMHVVYIIYSPKIDKYYVGETSDLLQRLHWHNTSEFKSSFPTQTNDWQLFWSLDCGDISIARKIEAHIKKMKSRAYYQNLKKHPGISTRLFEKYKG